MGFKGRSFCSAYSKGTCVNRVCYRAFTPKLRQEARKWWGGDGAPVAFMSVDVKTCPDFKIGDV